MSANLRSVRNRKEIKPGMIEPMKPKLTFQASEIQEGDIICFQWDEAVERE